MAFYKENENDIDINVTPLIDVVFILLIFFMISTTFVTTPGFKINLPKANAPSIKENDKNITISISKEGIINFEGTISNLSELKALITQRLKLSKSKKIEPVAVIQADSKTPHGIVVGVMEAIKQTGISKIAIATEKKTESK